MTKKQDLRIRRTKKALNTSLLTLMDRQHFSKITIQDLADEAIINRATFYLHYYDKYDLLETCIQDNMNYIMLKHIEPIQHIRDGILYTDVFEKIITEMLKSVEINESFFLIMFQSDCDKQMKDFLVTLGNEKIVPQIEGIFKKGLSERYKDITLQLIVSTVLGIISWWLTSEEKEEPEEIAQLIVGVVIRCTAYIIVLEIDLCIKCIKYLDVYIF